MTEQKVSLKNTLPVYFKVGSRLIRCHKLVLACVIPYFRYWLLNFLFSWGFKRVFVSNSTTLPCFPQGHVPVRDVWGQAGTDWDQGLWWGCHPGPGALCLLLQADFNCGQRAAAALRRLYPSGETSSDPVCVCACVCGFSPLSNTSSSLQVELVARACCEYMKAHFHPTNCLAVRTFAESHNRVDLMDMADRYACEHFTEVVECEDFTCVSPQHLRTLLSSSELNIRSETQVYNAAVKWLKANPQHHEPWLDQIISQVGVIQGCSLRRWQRQCR